MTSIATNGHSAIHTNGNNSHVFVKINGTSYEVDPLQVPITTSLNSFLRNHANLPGTKFMCLEGGCGACIVTATGKDPVTSELRSWAINSCLTPIYACDSLEITTIEGIGGRKSGYHPVQKRLTQFHGTQCGYCSPGMVMNMYSLLEANKGKVTMKDVENSFGGNICRCTGYRPILDAFKSMTVDADPKYKSMCSDIEELPKVCPKTGEACLGTCNGTDKNYHLSFPNGTEWFKPTNLEDLYDILSKIGIKRYMLVAGNTAHGVYRRDENIEVFIDLRNISDLNSHVISPNEVRLGGSVSLTDAMTILNKASKNSGFEYCTEIAKHIDLIANVPVRNAGTLAGNLCIKHAHVEFPSDLYVVLRALHASLTIGNISQRSSVREVVPIEDFTRTDMKKKIILNIKLKPYSAEKFIFRSYKIMPRAQNAHAYVNAAFLIELNAGKVASASLCFGGIQSTFDQAAKTEGYLLGKVLYSQETLSNAIELLQNEIHADLVLPDASSSYKNNLAVSLFYKFILATCPADKIPAQLKTGGELLERPLSSGVQSFDTYTDKWPMTQPVERVDGIVQTAGEAQFVNDIPHLPGQLWGAFVEATQVHATIINIDASEALKVKGVHSFFSARDIPGKNNFTPLTAELINEVEEIFCSKSVKYHGQPVGMILANSFELANRAAQMVKIQYEKSDEVIVPTICEAYSYQTDNRFHAKPISIVPKTEVSEAPIRVKGHFEMGGQYHFTMEPQTTVCVPTEDCLDVFAATQWVDMTQTAIAQCLNVPESSLNMQVRRLGGGYGAKISRASLVACACAIGAKLTNRPVRFVMSMESNMNVIGKRFGLISDYEVHVEPTGLIRKLVNNFAEDYGSSANEDVVYTSVEFHRNCYSADTWQVTPKVVLTDSASNTWCRAPGTTEGIAMIENIMEHISQVTGLDSIDVRLANIPNDNKMKTLLPEFLDSVEYKLRKNDIEKFNSENRWRKRGIAVVPMHYPQGFFGSIPVVVSIFHTDGTVAVTHGGVECGQGINTKVVQIAAKTLGIPMDYVKVKPSLNSVTANSGCTGGSMTSEAVGYATKRACETLLERMEPIREKMEGAKWPEITQACYKDLVELTAIHIYKSTDVQTYSIWGLSCAEVEVDVLTGNFNLVRVDILEDTGESISPHVDLGQVEGAFVMGLGYWLTESLVYDQTGKLLTNRTWNYKPPGAKDIPIDFRVTFLRNSSNAASVLRSKATGEPAFCMSIVAVFALRHAIESARKDAGVNDKWIELGAPTTVEKIFLSCATNPKSFFI